MKKKILIIIIVLIILFGGIFLTFISKKTTRQYRNHWSFSSPNIY